jgi:peptide/nickel transport system ATP-binding protein
VSAASTSTTPVSGAAAPLSSPPEEALTTVPGSGPGPSMPPAAKSAVVLDIRNVTTHFFTYDGVVQALDGVSFKIRSGETVGLVGETGCGKSVTAFSVTRLIADPPGRVMSGIVLYRGANLLQGIEREAKFVPLKKTNRVKVKRRFRRIKAAAERMAAVRGRGIAMIFQEPTSAMNPIFSVSNQLSEALLLHRGKDVIDAMFAATRDAPSVRPAFEELAEAAEAGVAAEALRVAAAKVGRALNAPSMATQAYYIAREAGPAASDIVTELEHSARRLHLGGLAHSYLRQQRRLIELQDELNVSYMDEMRAGHFDHSKRRSIRLRQLAARWRGIYLRIWGIRRLAQHALNEELFWRSVGLLEGMAIANPVQVARSYPHELSGGMLQRAMIAMALAADPDVLIADEPTTALDVTIQAQILELMHDLKNRIGTAILLITHDLAVIAEVADRVCVMYAGQVVESAPVRDLYRRPLHPYAQGLLASIPRLDQPDKELTSIPGSVPNLIFPPSGCRFHPRCPHAMPICRESRPPLTMEGEDHTVACFLYKGPVAVE